jgi:methyl-accepting chemotaxis protein
MKIGRMAATSTEPAAAAAKHRLGIKVKLQAAFAAVAIMTVAAAMVAVMSFSATQRDVDRVTNHDVPLMTDALRLSAISGEISAAAARLVSASSKADQDRIAGMLRERDAALKATMERLRSGSSGGAFTAVATASQSLEVNLQALEAAMAERWGAHETLKQRLDAVHATHTKIGEKLNPIVDDSYFDVVTSAEDVGKTGDKIVKSLVNDGLTQMQAIVEVGAETNLVTGLLTASTLTSAPPILALLEDRFTASANRAQKLLAKLPKGAKFDNLKTQVAALVDLANFKNRVAGENDNVRLQKIFRAHEGLANVLVTLIDDLNFDLVLQSEDAVKRSSKTVKELVNNQITGLRNALETAAQTHLVTSLVSEASIAGEPAMLVPIQDRFKASAQLLGKGSSGLANAEVKKAIAQLLAFGQGDDSVFKLRERELVAVATAARTIEDNVKIQHALDQAVSGLVNETEARMKDGTQALSDQLQRNCALLLIVAVASLTAAAAIAILYVQRSLINRLTSVGEAMRRLSSGDTDVTVPALADDDEIGDMARSLEIFRGGEIERRGMMAREKSEQEGQLARASSVEALINDFRATATAVIRGVTDNATQMETTARTLSGIAGQADQQTRAATVSSEQTSSNVRSVAAATEELGASIREISHQATQAKDVVVKAAEIARSTDVMVSQLADGATKIGDVIKLIQSIAGQTNLLALNATIEAARAGEAGKGFAIVASEVKGLANETAKATEEIAAQVGAIQESTGEAVAAIRSISEVMDDINRFAATIATAVVEQSASTEEIARNIQQAANGANDLAGNMTTVSGAIDATNRSATAVLDATNALSSQAGTLQQAVDSFLQRVATA